MLSIEDAISAPEEVRVASAADRTDVVTTIGDAAAIIEDGSTVAIGGLVLSNRPMPMVRHLVHSDLEDLTLLTPVGGLEIDILVGAAMLGWGSVSDVMTPHVGGGYHQALGTCFKQAKEHGKVDLWECSEGLLYAALFAESLSIPFLPWRGGVGSDIPNRNPDLVEIESPVGDDRVLAVPPISPDVAIIHVKRADRFGNGQHLGAPFTDTLVAQASDRVILTTEEVASNDVIRESSHRTTVPYSDYVVETPYGSHPFECQAAYVADDEWIREYIEATQAFGDGEEAQLVTFFEERMPADHEAYLNDLGKDRLDSLKVGSGDVHDE
jgi:glutaconate CoA-transferase subunit A